jgi:hypothetical protein
VTPGRVIAAGLAVLILLAGFTARGARRSAARRRTCERQAAVRLQALARFQVRLPAGHPETPLPPAVLEQARHGQFYDFVRDQLGDADAHDINQSGDQG